MNREEILNGLDSAVVNMDVESALSFAQAAIDAGISAADAVNLGLAKGMDKISRKFDEGEIYLPQIMLASRAMEAALKVLEPHMKSDDGLSFKGVIVMGSVKGDIHEIGKNVCCAMLKGAGFKVVDLGADVSPDSFARAAATNNADIVGASALMTTSLFQQRDVVRVFKEDKLSVMTIFGGAPCSQEWVSEIGGDGYSSSGSEIVELVRNLIAEKD